MKGKKVANITHFGLAIGWKYCQIKGFICHDRPAKSWGLSTKDLVNQGIVKEEDKNAR